MKIIKKISILSVIFSLVLTMIIPVNIKALEEAPEINAILNNMTNEEKIAQMIMPAFRYNANSGQTVGVTQINDDIQTILQKHGFAGVILFSENTKSVEQAARFIDSLQVASKKQGRPQLLIAIDQEGGYVTRLAEGTSNPGNMGLGATNDSNNAYESAKIIGSELSALGINVDFAPVVDVNSNPSNPIIGIRSFSDDPNMVGEYGVKFVQGLHSENIMTSLKHFPGHGDTNEDTHSKLSVVNKTLDELKNSDLIPFAQAIQAGTDMIMTAHIQYPNIEDKTFESLDGNTYTLPATLSSKFLKDILRDDMGYDGIIVTDALEMGAIAHNFTPADAAVRAINAGANILLIPFETKTTAQYNQLDEYVTTLAGKIGTEINEAEVNESVKRILKLKKEKGLLNEYDNSNLENNIANAKNIVSSQNNHDKEFEISKKGVTLVKNSNNVLPLKDSSEKTVIIYGWASHANSIDYALQKLIDNNKISADHNISKYRVTNTLDDIKEQIKDADNVIIEYTISGVEELNPNTDATIKKIDDIIAYAKSNNSKVIYLSGELPYDLARFQSADALMAVYNPQGMSTNPYNYDGIIPKYGPNIVTGIYMIFANGEVLNGKLPVNIPKLTSNYTYSDETLYARGFGLNYEYGNYEIIEGANQTYENGQDLVVKANGDINKFTKLLIDDVELSDEYYSIEVGSTIAKIKSSFIDTLSNGTHKITFVYTDGNVSTNFIVNSNTNSDKTESTSSSSSTSIQSSSKSSSSNAKNVNTGDNIYVYMFLFLVSIIGCISNITINRKHNI